MIWKDFPVSCFAEGTRTVFGAVLAFYLGLLGGTLMVVTTGAGQWRFDWPAILVAWMVLLSYTVAKLWGLLLLPFLGVMLIGMVWREWNRAIGASLVALAFSATVLFCAPDAFLSEPGSTRVLVLAAGTAVLVLGAGIAWESRQACGRAKPPPYNKLENSKKARAHPEGR